MQVHDNKNNTSQFPLLGVGLLYYTQRFQYLNLQRLYVFIIEVLLNLISNLFKTNIHHTNNKH